MAVQHMEKGQDIIEFCKPILDGIDVDSQREIAEDVLRWVHAQYPELDVRIAWGQPMFTHHGTFILGFSYAKKHFAVAPEGEVIEQFSDEFDRRGLSYGKKMLRIPWNGDRQLDLLAQLIDYNIETKADVTSFWR